MYIHQIIIIIIFFFNNNNLVDQYKNTIQGGKCKYTKKIQTEVTKRKHLAIILNRKLMCLYNIYKIKINN